MLNGGDGFFKAALNWPSAIYGRSMVHASRQHHSWRIGMVLPSQQSNRTGTWLLGIVLTFEPVGMAGSNAAQNIGAERGPITVHVLDTTLGKPGVGLAVLLEHKIHSGWKELARGRTDDAGRVEGL